MLTARDAVDDRVSGLDAGAPPALRVLDVNRDGGMTVTVGRLRPCPLFDYKFVALGHNTVRGAARDVNSVANCTENTMEGKTC